MNLELQAKENGLFLVVEHRPVLIYSQRALPRLAKHIIQEVQAAQQKGYIFFWIAPFYEPLAKLLRQTFFWWLDPFSKTLPPSNRFSFVLLNIPRLEEALVQISAQDKFLVQEHAPLARVPELPNFKKLVVKGLTQAASRLKTIQHFKKTWEYHSQRNQIYYPRLQPFTQYTGPRPSALVLASPFVSGNALKKHKHLWCCDTALEFVLSCGKKPDLVFSIDAAQGTYEHFYKVDKKILQTFSALVDPLVFPLVLELPFQKLYSYHSGHPLVPSRWPSLENTTQDVFGVMWALYQKKFPQESPPKILGHQMKHFHFISHIKPSAYFWHTYRNQNKFFTPELYFFQLSLRYP